MTPPEDAPTSDGSNTGDPAVAVPADFVAEVGPAWGHITLHWAPATAPVDSYEVQASMSGWTLIGSDTTVVPGAAVQAELDFTPAKPAEQSQISVKLRAHRGDLVSDFTSAATVLVPLQPPFNVFTTYTTGGVEIFHHAASPVATTTEIEKAELDAAGVPGAWSALATVPTDSNAPIFTANPYDQAYRDTAIQVGKAYAYRLTDHGNGAASTSVETTSLTIGVPLTSATIALLPGTLMDTDSNGHYVLETASPSGQTGFQVTWGDGQTWSNHTIADGAAPFGMKFDRAGQPHVIYAKASATPPGGTVIMHAWTDGTQWFDETIAQRGLDSDSRTPALQFDLDGAGQPVVVWCLHANDAEFEAALKSPAGWTFTSLDDMVPRGSMLTYHVFTDRSGTPHLVFVEIGRGIWHIQPDRAPWLVEQLPLTSSEVFWGTAGSGGDVLASGGDPASLVLCTQVPKPLTTAGPYLPGCYRRSATGWADAEPLNTLPPVDFEIGGSIATSPDGNRIAAVLHADGDHVFLSSHPGQWTETLIVANEFNAPRFVGFDSHNKLRVVYAPEPFDAPGTATFQVFSEP